MNIEYEISIHEIFFILIMNARIIIEDDILWIIKYLIDDSVDNTLSFSNKGINDIKDISNPAQTIIQLLEHIDTITPIIIVFMNINFVELVLIKRKKIFTSMFRV